MDRNDTEYNRDNLDRNDIYKRKCTYSILVGLFKTASSADYYMNSLKFDGVDAQMYEKDGLFQIQIGKFYCVEDAKKEQKALREKGYETLIICA